LKKRNWRINKLTSRKTVRFDSKRYDDVIKAVVEFLIDEIKLDSYYANEEITYEKVQRIFSSIDNVKVGKQKTIYPLGELCHKLKFGFNKDISLLGLIQAIEYKFNTKSESKEIFCLQCGDFIGSGRARSYHKICNFCIKTALWEKFNLIIKNWFSNLLKNPNEKLGIPLFYIEKPCQWEKEQQDHILWQIKNRFQSKNINCEIRGKAEIYLEMYFPKDERGRTYYRLKTLRLLKLQGILKKYHKITVKYKKGNNCLHD
jgi:hypothetical protein